MAATTLPSPAKQQANRRPSNSNSIFSSLKVFQASPLAYEYPNGDLEIMDSIDLEVESTRLQEALLDTKITVDFEIATADTLSKFLAQRNRLFQFSGHGTEEYLIIENNHGGAQQIFVDDNLNRWIQAGDHHLQLVVVLSCASRLAGDKFIQAGVPHVICYQDRLEERAAMVFSRGFYGALAEGNTIQEAFQQAQSLVVLSPEVQEFYDETGARVTRQDQADKFQLLPLQGNHDVSLFSSRKQQSSASAMIPKPCKMSRELSMIPMPPDVFLGREETMYRILKALFVSHNRLVCITGQQGIGKQSLAKNLGLYIEKRHMWGDMFWIPSIWNNNDNHHSKQDDDNDNNNHAAKILSQWSLLSASLEKCSNAQDLSSDKSYTTAMNEICETLHSKKAMVIINAKELKCISQVGVMLQHLFNRTKSIKVIVVHDETAQENSNLVFQHAVTNFGCYKKILLPWDFTNTARLFSRIYGKKHHSDDNVNEHDLVEKLEALTKHTPETTLLNILGGGIPSKIVWTAQNLPKEKVARLLFSNFSSRIVIREEDYRVTTSLRSQEEVYSRFYQLLKDDAKVYRKKVTSFIRRAKLGEDIITIIRGKKETKYRVDNDTSWVVCGRAAGEYYVISDKDFRDNYDRNSAKLIMVSGNSSCNFRSKRLAKQGFKEYQSKRIVYARKVNPQDMQYFQNNNNNSNDNETNSNNGEDDDNNNNDTAAYFIAPWGESVRVELGDYLVMQYPSGKDGIHRIECLVFHESYKEAQHPSLRSQEEVLKQFGSLLRTQGKVYRKSLTSFIRKARQGEHITTAIEGKKETEYLVDNDSSWVVCGRAAEERYVISQAEFEQNYDISSAMPLDDATPLSRQLKQECNDSSSSCYMEYRSKRKVYARQVDDWDMRFFRRHGGGGNNNNVNNEAYFLAPWGESVRVESGDYLATQYPTGSDGIYRIESFVFDETYDEIEEEQPDLAAAKRPKLSHDDGTQS